MSRRILPIAFIIAVAGGFVAYLVSSASKNQGYPIAVVSFVEIQPIVDLRSGFREHLEASNFAREHKLLFIDFNAQGDASLMNQIADRLVTDPPKLIFVLGTPAAQAIQKRLPEVLLVQGAATDPISAGLAASWSGSGRQYVANSDLPPVEKQVTLIQELTPMVKKLGVIYNPGEANSVIAVSRLRDFLAGHGNPLKLVERPIANASELSTVLPTLIGNADALYLPPDNTAYSGIKVIGRFATEQGMPFFATTKDALGDGALATLSLNYRELGKEAADLALRVLAGADPSTIPIQVNNNPSVFVNAAAAARLGIKVDAIADKPGVEIVKQKSP